MIRHFLERDKSGQARTAATRRGIGGVDPRVEKLLIN